MSCKHEVIYGGYGCGKSEYAFKSIDPSITFKLGVGKKLIDLMILKWGSTKKHEEANRKIGIEFKGTTIDTVLKDISEIQKPTFLLDDWSTFFLYSFLWSQERISQQANKILDAVEQNDNIQRAIYLTLDSSEYLPFNLYKKRALWNKTLFERADKITKIEYGIPIKIL